MLISQLLFSDADTGNKSNKQEKNIDISGVCVSKSAIKCLQPFPFHDTDKLLVKQSKQPWRDKIHMKSCDGLKLRLD